MRNSINKLKFTNSRGNVVEKAMPTWARWLAQDTSGYWWCFKDKPSYFSAELGGHLQGIWEFTRVGYDDEDVVDVILKGQKPKDASKELYKLIWK